MPSTGFEPAVPASEWPQSHALDSAAARVGRRYYTWSQIYGRTIMYTNLCFVVHAQHSLDVRDPLH